MILKSRRVKRSQRSELLERARAADALEEVGELAAVLSPALRGFSRDMRRAAGGWA